MFPRIAATFTSGVACLAFALGGCGKASVTPVVTVITQATLDSLPHKTITEGRRLCEADGRGSCPLGAAFGNWLDDTHFALWEPGRPVMIWSGTDTTALELGTTDGEQQAPVVALAVAKEGSGYRVLVTGGEDRLLHYNSAGHLEKPTALPQISGVFNRGFASDLILLERIRPIAGAPGMRFEVDVLGAATDTSGTPVMRLVLPWLTMADSVRLGLPPFFPAWPSFGVDRAGDFVWSPADRFVLHGSDAKGHERWTITGDFPGPEITPADMAARRAEALATGTSEGLTPEQVDTISNRTARYFPAISGIAASRKGDFLAVGAISPTHDSVTCYHIDADGKLLGQFQLPRRTRVVLFAGDSMLVHRPTEGEPWEVRWLKLAPSH